MTELNIGTRIADLRNAKNITQLELAEKLGVTDRAVSKWETGGSFPDIVLLPQIADIFGVSVDYLLRGKPVTRQHLEIGSADWTFAGSINDKYLADGWIITDMKFAADSEGGMGCAVVMEKEFFAD
ncbi:MAG: helix-turn-helix transcriptional regulator [Ruminococcaceae bacterium]|nr:helix-turn-helix transcriptional regulator [Oscillospiraceae bacterium]